MTANMQSKWKAVTTGFECVAMRFLAFEEVPIVLANEVRRAGGCEGQSEQYETGKAADEGSGDSRIVT